MSSSETIWTILNHSDLLQNTLGIIIILSWKYVTPQYYGLKDKTRVKETTGRLPFSPEIFGKKGEEWVVWCHCCIVVVISPNLEKIGHYTPKNLQVIAVFLDRNVTRWSAIGPFCHKKDDGRFCHGKTCNSFTRLVQLITPFGVGLGSKAKQAPIRE